MRVQRLEKEYGLEANWRAFNLRPDLPPEGMEYPYPPEVMRTRSDSLAKLFDEEGLKYQRRSWISNSRLAQEASEYARDRGKSREFHRSVFEAYFSNGKDIGKIEELTEIAESIDMDARGLADALEKGTFRGRVESQFREGWALGVTAIPTFIIGDKAIVGAYPYPIFQRVVRMVQESKPHS